MQASSSAVRHELESAPKPLDAKGQQRCLRTRLSSVWGQMLVDSRSRLPGSQGTCFCMPSRCEGMRGRGFKALAGRLLVTRSQEPHESGPDFANLWYEWMALEGRERARSRENARDERTARQPLVAPAGLEADVTSRPFGGR